MDHDVVVRQKMTERYLLEELDPQAKDEFEEHFFECSECAQDVRLASLFVERSKVVLAEPGEKAGAAVATPAAPSRGWFAWLRPAIAVPALALLLAVVGYQNLVTLPKMGKVVSSAQVLQWTSVNVGTFSGEGKVITTTPGSGFLLFVRIPPDGNYSSYKADLYDPAGKLEWTLSIPATVNQDQWPVQVPAAARPAGTYTLSLAGITSSGESRKVGQASFELQLQK